MTRASTSLGIAGIAVAALGGLALIIVAIVAGVLRDERPSAAPSRAAELAVPAAPVVEASADGERMSHREPGDTRTVADLADPAWVRDTAAATGIPARALSAYAGAALQLKLERPVCGLGWNTLAAIALVESEHGTISGGAIGADGRAEPDIIGIALDGDGVAAIRDSDGGELDGDTRWDRAVGPFQFIPLTWNDYAADGNLDGVRDIHNIDDSALAAARYLCAVGVDLRDSAGWIAAIDAYNQSAEYNNRVASAARHYANF